jgi:competence protein ComEC
MPFLKRDSSESPTDGEGELTDLPVQVQPQPRRILPVLALLFMAGLLAGAFFPVDPRWLAGSTILLISSSLIFHRSVWTLVTTYAAVIATAALLVIAESHRMHPNHIGSHLTRDRESITLTGVVVTMPQRQTLDASGRTNWIFQCEIESIRSWANDQPSIGRVRVMLPAEHIGQVAYGERWRLAGSIRRDQRSLLVSRGLDGMLYAEPTRSMRLESHAGSRWIGWCYAQRARAYERLGWGVGDHSASAAMSRALLLGYRQDVARPVYDAFAQTGTLHILALSGMHVGILILLLVILLKSLGISRQYWVLVFIPFLVVYTAATGASASTVRASIMALTYFSAFLLRRKPDTPSSLALAALLILAVDPMQLFSLGFILSFVAVGGLVVVYPRVSGWLNAATPSEISGDPAGSVWSHRWGATRQALGNAFGISLAAWLATLPLIATIFHLISPVALLVNLAMGPLAFVILLTSCLSLAFGAIWDQAGIVFNYANDVFAEVLLGLIARTSEWPGGYFYVEAWPLALILLWYGLLIFAIATTSWRRWGAVLGLAVLVVASIGQRSWSSRVDVVVIPNGDANVMLIDGPGRHAVLIDAGSVYHHRRLLDDLRSRGINRLEQVWLSRATTDAYGGLTPLISSIAIGEVVLPSIPTPSTAYVRQASVWRDVLGDDRVRYWDDRRYQERRGGVVYRVVHPANGATYRDARRSPLVIHVSRGHSSVIFAGRLNALCEAALIEAPIDWPADRWVLGSCEDPTAVSTPWLSRVNPTALAINLRGFERKLQGPGALLDRLHLFPALRVEEVSESPLRWSL